MRYHGRQKHRINPFPHFCLDNVPLKLVCWCRAPNTAKSLQHSHGVLGIEEFLFLCRLRYFGSQDMEMYLEGSIDAFHMIQSERQNSVFITMVIVPVNKKLR